MRVDVHYDDGTVETYTGESMLVYVIAAAGADRRKVTLGLGGVLDAIGICNLLLLLEMQLDGDKDMLEVGIELWREHRHRLRAEAQMMRDDKEGQDHD